jgi:predicted RNA-binding protein with PUA-like domain
MPKQYWLMKTEPGTFSFADLERVRSEPWTGVRSHFAKFHMRAMQVGDEVLFYHSSVAPPGVAGLARVERTGVVDETQFDPNSPYFDPRATREKPIWDCVDVAYVAKLPQYVALDRIRAQPELAEMPLLKRGMRLSVQPVTRAQYERIVALGHEPPRPIKLVLGGRPALTAKPTGKPARAKAKIKPRSSKPKPRKRGKR